MQVYIAVLNSAALLFGIYVGTNSKNISMYRNQHIYDVVAPYKKRVRKYVLESCNFQSIFASFLLLIGYRLNSNIICQFLTSAFNRASTLRECTLTSKPYRTSNRGTRRTLLEPKRGKWVSGLHCVALCHQNRWLT
jgi:hypothetical protein